MKAIRAVSSENFEVECCGRAVGGNKVKKARILVCDDEPDIVSALVIYLTSEDYLVSKASNGEEALAALDKEEIDLVLLDVMMPVMDGITTMAKIREKSNVPVIFLTAKSEDTDMVLGLNVGADDYITKPFNPVELIARVRSALRRYLFLGGGVQSKEESGDAHISIGGIEIFDDKKIVTLDGSEISLTPKEYDILKLMMENPGRVFSMKEIYEHVWREASFGDENTVAVHIRHLREKVEYDPSDPRHLKVVWGRGYKFE